MGFEPCFSVLERLMRAVTNEVVAIVALVEGHSLRC